LPYLLTPRKITLRSFAKCPSTPPVYQEYKRKDEEECRQNIPVLQGNQFPLVGRYVRIPLTVALSLTRDFEVVSLENETVSCLVKMMMLVFPRDATKKRCREINKKKQ